MQHSKQNNDNSFLANLKQIIQQARQRAYSAINFAQVEANWLLGQRIVEQEQNGAERAEYGKYVIKIASEELTKEFGSGFSKRNLENFKRFYLMFSELQIAQTVSAQFKPIGATVSPQLKEIQETVSPELKQIPQTLSAQLEISSANPQPLPLLSWSHYERLMRIENPVARQWYMTEAAEQMWAVRTLDRNISTQYYERMLLSQMKEPVIKEMHEKTTGFQQDKLAFIKNPTVMEFLGLPSNSGYVEKDIEKAIINNLQQFLIELGKGFAFVGRQQLIRTEAEDYFIDLVFYNYILKCFVLIDLKMGKITHQDVGQMDMYVRMFDEMKRIEGDNPTIGIVLCSETDKDIARYSILKGNEQLFATKYKLFLPTDEELRAEIERQKEILRQQFNNV
ncbi:MAG: PDDEXK nuclease domain-containing protein [Bacteroidales bacterium]|nr:PDDEXK nuclease domain-containing protein [Bacteroidales bacterium]